MVPVLYIWKLLDDPFYAFRTLRRLGYLDLYTFSKAIFNLTQPNKNVIKPRSVTLERSHVRVVGGFAVER